MRRLALFILPLLLAGCGQARLSESTLSLSFSRMQWTHRELVYTDLLKSPTAQGFRWHGQNVDLGGVTSKSEVTGADISNIVANIAAVALKAIAVP